MVKVPFSPPRMDQKIADEVTDTLFSGWITTGPKTKLFERKIEEFIGVEKVLCLNSATAGLEMALRWFGVGEGDEVILPAYTYCATANVIVHCGAKPVFVDVADDFNIDLADVAKKINSRTKVIMPVDIGGMPCNYDELFALVSEVRNVFSPRNEKQKRLGRIMILADAAHSFGAMYKGHHSGQLADMSSFSFHAVKNLTTAEGGALAFNLPETFTGDEIYKELVVKTLHGQSKDALAKTKGSWKYDVLEAGYKCNMTDIAASIGLIELERYRSDTLVKRRAIYDSYVKAFEDHPWAIIPEFDTEDKRSSYHVFMLRIDGITEIERDNVISQAAAQDVALNVHFQPVPAFSAYKNMGYSELDYPNAWKLYSNEISLPVFYDISPEQINAVVTAVVEGVKKYV